MQSGVKVLAAAAGATAVFIGAASYSAGTQEDASTAGISGATGFIPIAEGQYAGVCAVVTPPDPDPCDAVNGTLRYVSLASIVNVPYLAKWRAANPGEVQRLASRMQAPVCSIPTSPQPQIMLTQFGAHLEAIMSAIACARHPEPITWPTANPALNPARADKVPPSPPGPITVTPSG